MIRVLEKNIADKIAAGEVVERPLSIVKELVENSIDAGASKIVVEIKDGGKTYIRVTDDGIGIDPDDCEKAFMRHATSKITSEKDLEGIGTLGFRGEALASICAVSRTELLTKTRDLTTGKKVVIHGGEVVENKLFGCPDGTTIIVRDLFYNTPARLKFLKSKNAESSAVIEFVTQIALAYPEIKVRMINNDKILFSTNGKCDRLNTIATLTSKIHTNALIPFNYEKEHIYVEGYVSGPGESKNSRKSQIFFVNGRVINSKVIERGINQAYSERLFEGRFPICYLFLKIDPTKVDVNIHPNKKEVRFFDEQAISQIVKDGILTALNTHEAFPKAFEEKVNVNPFKKEELKKEKEIKIDQLSVSNENKKEIDIKNILSTYENKQKNDYKPIVIEEKTIKYTNKISDDKVEKPLKPLTPKFDFSSLNIAGQFFKTYIQLYDDKTIYFIDQHAAHERVFYEKFLNQYKDREKLSQYIMIPIIINISHSDKSKEDKWMGFLQDLGFNIEPFGPLTYRVTEIPMFLDLKEAESFLNDYIDNLDSYKDFKDEKTLHKIATKACKAAIKANDILSEDEIKALLKEMELCENPFSCPHGRPVFIKITKTDLEKRFKRI